MRSKPMPISVAVKIQNPAFRHSPRHVTSYLHDRACTTAAQGQCVGWLVQNRHGFASFGIASHQSSTKGSLNRLHLPSACSACGAEVNSLSHLLLYSAADDERVCDRTGGRDMSSPCFLCQAKTATTTPPGQQCGVWAPTWLCFEGRRRVGSCGAPH